MKNLTIRVKLLTSFIFLVIITTVVGWIGYAGMNSIMKTHDEVSEVRLPSMRALLIIKEAQGLIDAAEKTLLSVNADQDMRNNAYLKFEKAERNFNDARAVYEALPQTNEDAMAWNRFVIAWDKYWGLHETGVDLAKKYDANPNDTTYNAYSDYALITIAKPFNDVTEAIDELVAINNQIAIDKSIYAKENFANVERVLFIVILLAAFLAIILGFIISGNIRNVIKSVVKQVNTLANNAVTGKLKARAKPEDINKEFRDIAVGFNNTLDAIIKPLDVAADYIDKISKGNIPEKITDNYNGDFNILINNLNQCIEAINLLSKDTTMLVDEAVKGKLTERADTEKHQGDFKKIIEGINNTLDSVVGFLDNVPTPVMAIDDDFNILYINNLGAKLGNQNAKQLLGSKCYNHFNTNHCNTENCASFKAINTGLKTDAETKANPGNKELEINYSAVPIRTRNGKVIGALEVIADQTDIKKAMRKIEKVNKYQLLETKKLTDAINKFARGDVEIKLETEAADEETLEIKELFDKINFAVNSTVTATIDIIEKAKSIADGDLTVKLKKRSEKDELMIALSNMIENLSRIVSNILTGASNIASSSSQMSLASQEMAQGTSEQSSSIEEVTSSIEQMSANIKQNTENAQETEKLAIQSSKKIIEANQSVEITVNAMNEINNKITLIDDIAERIDILAINAAIEAARAGEHGKGFAVVAAEIRKLAENSQNAAKVISEVSQNSVDISKKSGELLSKVVPDIQNTTSLVQNITAASKEQSSGSSQIVDAINQLNSVISNNAASAEELSSSSEELDAQAINLRELMGFFKLSTNAASTKIENFDL